MLQQPIIKAVTALKNNGVIAYPTEAVYGFGCDPHSEIAVRKLNHIKQRADNKGYILLAAEVQQILPYIALSLDDMPTAVLDSWPGHVTWIFPASVQAPASVIHPDKTVAVRVTAFPTARALINAFGKPIISTSANLAGMAPLTQAEQVTTLFDKQVDYIMQAPVGNATRPSEIRQALTGKIIRF